MADPSDMATFLRLGGRRNPLMDEWYSTPPPLSYPVSEYTTPAELGQERISQAMGWDTTRPGRYALGQLMTYLSSLPLGGRVPSGRNYLSPNMANSPREFDYLIMRGGFPVGEARGYMSFGHRNTPMENVANIDAIRGIGPYGPNSLGPSTMRQLMEAAKRDFPDVNTFTGIRISGARQGASDTRQVVRLPTDQLELPLSRPR